MLTLGLPLSLPHGCPQDHGETMTFTKEESLILERIEREFAERQASDARLHSLLTDLHGAFNAAIKIATKDAHA